MMVALYRVPQRLHGLGVDVLEAAECLLHHGPPELTLAKRLAAAAQLVLGEAPPPDVPQLADGGEVVHLPQQAQQDGAAASAVTADIQHFDFLLTHCILIPSCAGSFEAGRLSRNQEVERKL